MVNQCFLFCVLFCVGGVLGQRVGNPDDTAIIERPCRTYDMNCIREFFHKHADCKKSYLQVPDPFIRSQSVEYDARLNLTITIIDEVINGINGRIEEFYINRDTDNLVFAVEFRNLNKVSNNSYFTFHRRAKEPVVTRAYAEVLYPSVVMTAIIPNVENLQLERAEITTFANDAAVPTFISPEAGVSSDPQVQRTLVEFFADIRTHTQEVYLKDTAFYVGTFIQYKLCDFGLQLT